MNLTLIQKKKKNLMKSMILLARIVGFFSRDISFVGYSL